MQKDMHYYGTYVLARIAGMKQECAHIVASASQFVDDSDEYDLIHLENGESVSTTVTAHGATSLKNLDVTDQRYIWVPFHFLPGGVGSNISERLTCVQDGEFAKSILEHAYNVASQDTKNRLFYLGIIAHVYADTFSHSGFSGISSDLNKVVTDSIEYQITDKKVLKHVKQTNKEFLKKAGILRGLFAQLRDRFIGEVAESTSKGLGHGSVATCPDRPYLDWSFSYEAPVRDVLRNNPEKFLAGCEALYKYFQKCCELLPDIRDNKTISFDGEKGDIQTILQFEGTEEERSTQWNNYIKNKKMISSEELHGIPEYKGDKWKKTASKNFDKDAVTDNDMHEAIAFHRSAEAYQYYILKTFLPGKSIVIV